MTLCAVLCLILFILNKIFSQLKHFTLSEPDWASYTLGIFVCLNCSGIHRNLPAVSKVKSIRLDNWDDSLVEVQFVFRLYQ